MARERIAVLGGGLGSLATLFHLTEQADWQERWDITLYQQGWRLGGKCASGRDMAAGRGARILEHGLHLFGGFYHYTFAMMRRCYEALDKPQGHPNRRFFDAVLGVDSITLMDRIEAPDGSLTFDPWYINFETLPGQPGDGVEPLAIPDLMRGIIRLVALFDPSTWFPHLKPKAGGPVSWLEHAVEHVGNAIEAGVLDIAMQSLSKVLTALEGHAGALPDPPPGSDEAKAIKRAHFAVFLAQTVIRGIVVDEVAAKGFNQLDNWELKEWIRHHGEIVAREFKAPGENPASAAAALAEWPVVRASYDYVFGNADGDPAKPAQGAGTALRGMLRLAFGYKGHLFYAMRGGMGDVVIAPLYQELARRGVRFEFFSRVERLVPGGEGIEAIEIARQAVPIGGRYDPLVDVPAPGWPADAALPSWPSAPLWNQIEGGEALRDSGIDLETPWSPARDVRILRRGFEFDRVVLGIPIGELKRICADLTAVRPAWERMLTELKTTRTIGVQLWFTRTNEDLGCPSPHRTLTGNAQPLSCWGDFSHLLARENWTGPRWPQSLHYFCGQLPGEAATSQAEADAATAKAGDTARAWLSANGPILWPETAMATSAIGLDPSALHDHGDRVGEARFLGQYWRANTTPSELYVQYVPGSFGARLRANESGFDNLFLCGDWTRNGLNAGAAESAVMSGVICARVLAGDNSPIPGEGD